ncbi:EF-hand domain-containing protein [Rubritalea marina]|uniref:EF-hand domain-containing protein n=1 Tax=Rubritalea marina TaxID=361055 RepID=UPI00036D9EA7|nr:EF-hand domain-containing protein [Rubritalea marina]
MTSNLKPLTLQLLIACVLMSGSAMAAEQEEGGAREGGKPGKFARDGEMHQRVLKRFDADGDGVLSDEERSVFRQEMQKKRAQGARADGVENRAPRGGKGGAKHQERRKKFLMRFDKDGDGKLSESERQVAREWMQKRRKEADSARKRVMLKFDSDGDGKISPDEAKAVQRKLKAFDQQARRDLLDKYDTNGDGKLTADEKRSAHAAEKQAMIDQYDTDGDGELSAEERKAAFEDMLENDPMRLLIQLRKQNKQGGAKPRRGGFPMFEKNKPTRGAE